jgi:hypothetical protein
MVAKPDFAGINQQTAETKYLLKTAKCPQEAISGPLLLCDF